MAFSVSLCSAVLHNFKKNPIRSLSSTKVCAKKMATNLSNAEIIGMTRTLVQPLSSSSHKGQCGRIGIVGGSKEYTGAPYYAAISALKVGADLAFVFSTAKASSVIKTYSPELIVNNLLDDPIGHVEEWAEKCHSLVIGPGLGRDVELLPKLKTFIDQARGKDKPVIIDADGLYYFTEYRERLLKEPYKNVTITPNKVEFERLYKAVMLKEISNPTPEDVINLAKQLNGVTIVKKGQVDVITDGESTLQCEASGSDRRCGGQGDLLSGSLGVFAHWAQNPNLDESGLQSHSRSVVAGYAACLLTRECNRQAFEKHYRAMTTTDMIPFIGPVFYQWFEHEIKNRQPPVKYK